MNGRFGYLPIFLILQLLILLPFVFAQIMGLALMKLRLDPSWDVLMLGIILGKYGQYLLPDLCGMRFNT